ncbi:MAG: hypothetical protein AB9897_04185 [Anaerolineaceae bacterium]
MKKFLLALVALGITAALVIGYFLFLDPTHSKDRSAHVIQFIRHPEAHADWKMQSGTYCGSVPFQFPTSGLIGYLWGDTFKIGSRHQGIDIFSGTEPGLTPIFSVYDGYLSRLPDWKSSLIIRIPSDPLNPGTQIWTYYTHLADASGSSFISSQFPPGTSETFVKAGTFLGFMGNYSGDPGNPVGVHLHFSIIKDDGTGHFLNELEIANTLDPSAYFGLSLNTAENPTLPILCSNPVATPTR